MSFGETWYLPRAVSTYSDADLVDRVRALLPPAVEVSIRGSTNDRSLRVSFRAADVDVIAARFAESAALGSQWRRKIEPPSPGPTYTICIDILDDEAPIMRISSNDDSNREAWPLLCAIAHGLADSLEATVDPDDDPSLFADHAKWTGN